MSFKNVYQLSLDLNYHGSHLWTFWWHILPPCVFTGDDGDDQLRLELLQVVQGSSEVLTILTFVQFQLTLFLQLLEDMQKQIYKTRRKNGLDFHRY